VVFVATGGFFRDATDRWSEGRLRDLTGDGSCGWLLFFGTFGGLDTVVKVGGDFRWSPSGKLTVLEKKEVKDIKLFSIF